MLSLLPLNLVKQYIYVLMFNQVIYLLTIFVDAFVFLSCYYHIGYEMNNAKVQVTVYYSDNTDVTGLTPVVDIVGLDLCTLSSKVTCPIKAESNILINSFSIEHMCSLIIFTRAGMGFPCTKHSPWNLSS